ncbi:MAG TPA: DegQ family serine endoprotease [Candidatus Binataceae bacterium]|jgi:serine protease Do|nr:DegQ family serine endoprotease [Candidatus Binataceae bacterium]
MLKKIAAVSCGVLLGIVIAFARAGAFPFWNSSSQEQSQTKPAPANKAPGNLAQASSNPEPAPPNQPEPNEAGVPIHSFAPLVKRVMPSVVNVSVVQEVKSAGMPFGSPGDPGEGEGPGGPGGPEGGPGPSPFGPFGQQNPFEQFRRFFGQIPREYKQHGLGSGVIVSPDGYILTNNHVVGRADSIHVRLLDKREFTAKVVGKDPKTDLALIKIDTKQPLPVAILGDSNTAQIGDWVIAIGSPFGFTSTVTAGIISAKGRALGGNYDDFIQTDASINPGNSGGPLFNTKGQVIGINTAIYSSTGSNAGIGFAIPVNLAKQVMEQLKEHGRVIRGWLGVEIQEVTPDLAQSFNLPKPEGALVANVEKDGPALKAGIQRGDIIVEFNGHPVQDEHQLPELVAQTPIGTTVPVVVIRGGKRVTLHAKVGELKEEQLASAKSEEPGSNWGLQVQAITPEIANQLNLSSTKGVVVRGVQPDSPAADAGIQPGDVVLEVNHAKVNSVDDFLSAAKQAKKDKKSTLLLVARGNSTMYTVIKPAS